MSLQVLQCVEKLLFDLNEISEQPFGGKLMLLGGDWKQLLPVVRSTYGVELLEYTLKRSELWRQFEVRTVNGSKGSYAKDKFP